jgi:hypothetical protein
MSADLTIEATVITQTGTDLTPVGVTVKGTGSIPFAALAAIAQEAVNSFTGSIKYVVDVEPTHHEQADDTVTMFRVL